MRSAVLATHRLRVEAALPLLLALLIVGLAGPAAFAQTEQPVAAEADAPVAPEKPAPVEDFSNPMGPSDPFNRGTPRGSMYGYLSAARASDFERAAEYLDLRRLSIEDAISGPEVAKRLKMVLDQTLWVDVVNLADSNEGIAGDGLPKWQDRFGEIESLSGKIGLLMQRVPREGDRVRIWKISAVTVEQLNELYAEFEPVWLEEWLPPLFFSVSFFDVQLWKWLGLVLLLFVARLVSILIAGTSTRLLGLMFSKDHEATDDRIVELLNGPVRLAWTVILFALGHRSVGLALPVLDTLHYFERLALVVAGAWLVFRMIDLAALAMRIRAERRDSRGVLSVLVPTARFAKVVVVLIGILGVLGSLGVNVTAAVAGLGVGGIAIALAAQKTIENLFGGATLFADRPVQVGDFFRYGTDVGTVEEIGLRSTRIRTRERTIVTIPNAEFSNLRLENYEKRDRMRLQTIIGVRYETTSDQLRYLLARLREVLIAHPRALPKDQRVRFVGFGAYSLDIEIITFVDTESWREFLAIREDVYLLIMDVVKEAGTSFAFPSSTMYVGRDEGLSAETASEVEGRVREWREAGKLPFPNVSEDHYDEIENSLVWPPPGAPERMKDQ